MLNLIKGVLMVYFGLVLFLAAVESIYINIGYEIGQMLSTQSPWVISIIALIIGALTVLAEPAIHVLINQVEETTNGLINKRYLLTALAIGVGTAILLAIIRILYKFSILYILVPGYVICFVLSFFIPKLHTAIAFDAGGVASGPLTSSFILPIALGLCGALNNSNEMLNYGFGVIALVALSPIISIELLGLSSKVVAKRNARIALKKALQDDDKVLIAFGDDHEK